MKRRKMPYNGLGGIDTRPKRRDAFAPKCNAVASKIKSRLQVL